MTNVDNISEHTDKKLKSASLVLAVQAMAFVASFVITSLREYGGFNYFEYSFLVQDVIFQSLGAVFILPIIHMGIASIWKSKRNKLTRRNIFFGWAVAVGLLQLAGLFMLKDTLNTAELNYNQTSIKGLARAYGFILGQDFSLSRIKKEYPGLAPSVLLANSQFNSSFPNIRSKLKSQLVVAMGKNLFSNTDNDLKKQLQANLGTQVITKEIAQRFLQQVKERAEGNIESPVLEYMLSVKYLAFPANEFLEGYRKTFNTEGHKKAQGLNVVLQLPKSWKAKEGKRPHIVQKWVSANGTGLEVLHLDIRDAEGYTPSNKEIESFVSSGEVRNNVPGGAKYISSGLFSLEMRKGYWIEMAMPQERAGFKLYQRSVMYQLFFRGKAIGLVCQATSPIEGKAKADEAYKKIKPLCQQVLNSFVLLQAY